MSTTLEWTTADRATVPSGLTELVRGSEQALLERLLPQVREQDVALDLENVSRIDAAGVAVLIQLYCAACQAGHSFTVANAGPRVAEILVLVELDRVLIHHVSNRLSPDGMRTGKTAA
jgi:anti-anti-sigma factor